MAADTTAVTGAARQPGFFAKLFGALRYRLRRIFGKTDDPNIYPFF